MEPTTRAELVAYILEQGVRADRAERWVDQRTGLLSGDVPAELITQPGQRTRALTAARRFAEHQGPGFRWD